MCHIPETRRHDQQHSDVSDPIGECGSAFPGLIALILILVLSGAPATAMAQHRLPIEIVPGVGHSAWLTSFAFSADGTLLAAGSADNRIDLWDVSRGKLIRTFSGHTGWVLSMVFSPDQRQLLSASNDKTVRLWDIVTGKTLRTFEHADGVDSVAFSPDGSFLATAAGRMVTLWKTTETKQFRSYGPLPGDLHSVAFSPDGKRIVAGGFDALQVLAVATGDVLRNFDEHSGLISTVAFLTDDQIISGTGQEFEVWSIDAGSRVRRFGLASSDGAENFVGMFALSPDRQRVAAVGHIVGTLHLWDVSSGNLIRKFEDDASSEAVGLSTEYVVTASGHEPNEFTMWSVYTGRRVHDFTANLRRMAAVAFSADSRMLISGGNDESILFWDVSSGKLISSLGGFSGWSVVSLGMSEDGRRLISEIQRDDDHEVRVWELPSQRLQRVTSGSFEQVALASKGDLFATAARPDKAEIKIWDARTGATMRTIREPWEVVGLLAISPDGRQLAASGVEHAACVGLPVRPLAHRAMCRSGPSFQVCRSW